MIAFWFIVTTLAVYRVARMIAEERGPFDLFAKWRGWLENLQTNTNMRFVEQVCKGSDERVNLFKYDWLVDGFNCVFCLSFWIAFLFCVPVAVTYQFSVFQYILSSLAVSGLVVMIHRYFG